MCSFPLLQKGKGDWCVPVCSYSPAFASSIPIVEIPVASSLASPIPATSGPAHAHMLDRPGRVAPCLTRVMTFLVLREVMGWGFSIYRIKLSHLLLSPGMVGKRLFFFPWDYH